MTLLTDAMVFSTSCANYLVFAATLGAARKGATIDHATHSQTQ